MADARGSNRIIVGIVIVALGVMLLLDSTGVAETGSLARWIPSLFVLLGLWRLVAGGFRRVFGPVLIIAIAGVIQLGLLDLDVGDYWPVLLIILGVALLFRGPRLRRRAGGSADPSRVDAVAIMGGSEHRIASQDFVGGQAVSVMGGIEIDLSEAAVIERPATLDVTVVMGGVEITVPADWSVSVDALVLMGGSSDERKAGLQREPSIEEPHDLVVNGLVLMGGVEVKG